MPSIKIPIEPLGRTETVPFFDYTLSVEINGTKENPQTRIFDVETKQKIGSFNWFEENIILSEKTIDDKNTEQFFILGDFTTR